MAILISFDIDGTLEIGDPPGVLTMDMVRRARQRGFLIGSCSDRPISTQRILWEQHDISIDFAVGKMMLPEVMARIAAVEHVLIEKKVCSHEDLLRARQFIDEQESF